MKSSPVSHVQEKLFSDSMLATTGRLVFQMEIDGRLPSWNDILGMEQWARYKFKNDLAKSFLSSLQALERDSSTGTTCAKNSTLTYAATLEFYLTTALARRKSNAARKRQNQKDASTSALKFTKSEVPF